MYTYWPYPTYPPYFTGYCPCCGRPWQNPYMTTSTWSDTVSYGRPFYRQDTTTIDWNAISNYGDVLKEQEKAAEEKSTDVKKDD